jgi:hypothetical protein
MTMRTALVVVVLFATTISSVGFAQKDRVIYKKRTFIDMGDFIIDGRRDTPPGTYQTVPPRPKFRILVPVRTNFLPELQRSSDAL